MEKTQESNSNKGNLGLNIGIATYKVLTTDQPKVKQLKEAIARIDEVLISGHSDWLLYENQSVCSESLFARFTVHFWIRKRRGVATCVPNS